MCPCRKVLRLQCLGLCRESWCKAVPCPRRRARGGKQAESLASSIPARPSTKPPPSSATCRPHPALSLTGFLEKGLRVFVCACVCRHVFMCVFVCVHNTHVCTCSCVRAHICMWSRVRGYVGMYVYSQLQVSVGCLSSLLPTVLFLF